MPIHSQHPTYVATISVWRKIRDAVAGEERVKANSTYLPRLSEMTATDYDSFVQRAKFYAAPEKTLAALLGLVVRKSADVVLNDTLAALLKDVDGSGASLDVFASRVLSEVLTMGRVGISADIIDGRMTLTMHPAETIINWRADAAGRPTMLVTAREEEVVSPDDRYLSHTETTYRHWEKTPDGIIFKRETYKNGELIDAPPEVVLSAPQGALENIPFLIIGQSGVAVDIKRSPLLPIVNLALHYYLLSADRNWGLHFTALATPYVIGVNAQQAPSGIGPTCLWAIANENAKVGMLEFSGAGVQEIAAEMEADKREMADMGARLLESRARAAEAAATVEMKMGSDSASLATICESVSSGITMLLRIASEWLGRPDDEVYLSLNRDFMPTKLPPVELTALVNAWLNGAISSEELYASLQEGEIIDPSKPFELHAEEIEKTAASRGGGFEAQNEPIPPAARNAANSRTD